jgi:hypothetical protein
VHARDQVRSGVVLRHDARLDARLVEEALDVRDARAFVPGRVRRVEPNEIAEQLDDVHYSSSSAFSSRSTSAAVL